MKERIFTLFGVIGPFIAYFVIIISIIYSPWFSWQRNALSDLGHSVKSVTASIFNFGLLLTGFLIIIYVITIFQEHAKYTSFCLVVSAFILQSVAMFNEVYGFIHGVMAVLFFVSLWIASIVNAVEKKSFLALIVFIIGFGVWVLYGFRVYDAGIAVPEIVSFAASASLLQWSAIKILRKK
jgi:hypothetical membrane protein